VGSYTDVQIETLRLFLRKYSECKYDFEALFLRSTEEYIDEGTFFLL
jgi:hypothetical protein